MSKFSWDGLIKFIEENQEGLEYAVDSNVSIVITMIKNALKRGKELDGKFDVLQHLREGGKIKRESEPSIHYTWHPKDANFLRPTTDKVSSKFIHCLILHKDWQPGEEQLTEDALYKCVIKVNNIDIETKLKWTSNGWANNRNELLRIEAEPLRDADGNPIKCVKG